MCGFSLNPPPPPPPPRCGFVAQWLERATRIRKTLGSIPAGLRCVFFFLDLHGEDLQLLRNAHCQSIG